VCLAWNSHRAEFNRKRFLPANETVTEQFTPSPAITSARRRPVFEDYFRSVLGVAAGLGFEQIIVPIGARNRRVGVGDAGQTRAGVVVKTNARVVFQNLCR